MVVFSVSCAHPTRYVCAVEPCRHYKYLYSTCHSVVCKQPSSQAAKILHPSEQLFYDAQRYSKNQKKKKKSDEKLSEMQKQHCA